MFLTPFLNLGLLSDISCRHTILYPWLYFWKLVFYRKLFFVVFIKILLMTFNNIDLNWFEMKMKTNIKIVCVALHGNWKRLDKPLKMVESTKTSNSCTEMQGFNLPLQSKTWVSASKPNTDFPSYFEKNNGNLSECSQTKADLRAMW